MIKTEKASVPVFSGRCFFIYVTDYLLLYKSSGISYNDSKDAKERGEILWKKPW